MDWRTEALETLRFHEEKQKEHGKGKQGRPESISGKKGWGIRDTAKAKGISYKHAYDLLLWGIGLRRDPKYDNRVSIRVLPRAVKLRNLENLLGVVRGAIFILKKDKRTLKIGTDLEKALREYEH